ncbi:MAG: histidine kinase dimerization/phospho-acceptor domain-containing protein, partial [Agathobacter sp.]
MWQKNFSANAAHELRTPLALTKTQVDVFQMREDRSLTEYSALLHSISESTDRLSHLVNDLLTQELLEPIFCGCKSHFLDKKYLEENR